LSVTEPPAALKGSLTAARREIGVVAALLVAAAGLLGFLSVADAVTDNHTRAFDMGVLMMLRTPGDIATPIGPAWLKQAAMDITSLGSVIDLTLIVLVVAGLFLALRRWREALLLVAAGGSGLIVVDIVKILVGRQRPPLAMHVVQVANASFPSGHAMLSAIVYLSLATLAGHFAGRRRVRIYALGAGFAATVIVGVSRVYLGVHWPTDVIGGWALGAAWAMVWWLITWFLEHRHHKPGTALRG
jgi:undecaprenyl-diphosphatase